MESTHRDFVVDAGGVRLAARDYGGDGTPLVLLNGLGITLLCWDELVPLLRDRFRIIAYEHRGHGRSETGPSTSMADLVEDLRAVVAELDLDRPVVHGHSLGGLVALRFASQGGHCRAVICEDTGALHVISDSVIEALSADDDDPPTLDEAKSGDDLFALQSRVLAGEATPTQFEMFIRRLRAFWDENGRDTRHGDWAVEWARFEAAARRGLADQPDESGILRPRPERWISRNLRREALEFVRDSLASVYERITVPTLVIFGEKTAADSLDDKRAFATRAYELNPRLSVRLVPHAGHRVHRDRPSELAEIIRVFAGALA